MSVLEIVFLALYSAAFTSFSWGMRYLFTRPTTPTPGTRVIAYAVPALVASQAISFVRYGLADTTRMVPACAAVGGSLVLFWSAVVVTKYRPLAWAFSGHRPDRIVERGPYRLVRHPFYSSYLLAAGSGAVASAWMPGILILVPLVWIYYSAAFREERDFEHGPLHARYGNYRASVGMFLPRLPRIGRLHRVPKGCPLKRRPRFALVAHKTDATSEVQGSAAQPRC